MHALYLTSVVVHILAAMLWVGGMAFFALVVVPTARRALDEERKGALLRAAGIRFGKMSGATLVILLVTGVTNLWLRGLLPMLGDGAFWSSGFGKVLALKLLVFVLIVAATTYHSREATRGTVSSSRSRVASMAGRMTLLLSVLAVVLAVMLVRGTP